MASDQDKRKLSDLRVVDIRSELDKRGIDKNGVKAVILDRLTKALEDEGHDVESYIFEPLGKSTLKRQSASKNRVGSEQDSESEPPSGPTDDAHDLSMDVDEDIAADGEQADSDHADAENAEPATANETNGNEEHAERKLEEKPTEKVQNEEAPVENNLNEADTETDINPVEKKPVEKKPIEVAPLEKNLVESPPVKKECSDETSEEKVSVEKSSTGSMEPPTAEKVAATVRAMKTEAQETRQAAAEKLSHDVNGVDNEDSINLDIGEDEEKLLADEDDSCGPEKDNKDEGERARKSKQGKEAAAKDEDRKRSAASEENSSKTQDDQKDDKAKSGSSQEQKSKDDKDKSKRGSASGGASSRNLWVSGLSSATRATDLKQVFSKHGKVIGAKVVTNARTPGARCYGYVTMATSEEASKCIQYLHRTELHGRMISVERAKGEAGPKGEGKVAPPEKKRHDHKANGHADSTKSATASGDASEEKKTSAEDKTGDDKRKRRVEAPAATSTKPRSPHRPARQPVKAPSPAQRKPRPIAALLTFAQIREERERQRLREREREVREEERRRREMIARQREVERKNRDEAARLEREKEKLRAERERIEVERAQLLRMERERQRLERERLEREREELKRHQLRLEAARRPTKPPVVKERRDYDTARHAVPPAPAPPSARFDTPPVRRAVKRPAPEERRTDTYVDDRKRAAPERRFEAPPTARFEEPSSRLLFPSKKETRRPEFSPPPRREPSKFERPFVPADVRIVRPSHDAGSRREQVSPGVRIKDARFDRGGGDSGARAPVSGYRREERRPEPDHRAKGDMRSSGRERYPESKPSFSGSSKGESRYTDRGGSTWHAGTGPAPSKPFMGSLPPAHRVSPWERKDSAGPWARPTDSSWSGGGNSAMVGSYSSSGLTTGMSSMSGGPYNSDRFDSYKPSLGQVRKY